ncbi:MAG: hypothetical protein ACRES4_05475 [Nevskiales bacterium]
MNNPEHYAWSGHRDYLGGSTVSWLNTEWVLSQFNQNLSLARVCYARFVQEGAGMEPDSALVRSRSDDDRILGTDDFTDRLLGSSTLARKPRDLDAIILNICGRSQISVSELSQRGRGRRAARARALIVLEALREGSATLTELAKRFGRDSSTLCKSASRHRKLPQKPNNQL